MHWRQATSPWGISEYDIDTFLPEYFQSSLPTIEEIEAEFADVEIDLSDRQAEAGDTNG